MCATNPTPSLPVVAFRLNQQQCYNFQKLARYNSYVLPQNLISSWHITQSHLSSHLTVSSPYPRSKFAPLLLKYSLQLTRWWLTFWYENCLTWVSVKLSPQLTPQLSWIMAIENRINFLPPCTLNCPKEFPPLNSLFSKCPTCKNIFANSKTG